MTWRNVHLTDVSKVGPRDQPLSEDAPFVPMAAVEVGRRHPTSYERRGSRGGIRARGNDVLFARITPCLENGKLAQLPADAGPTGGSTEFIVVRAGPELDPGFLYYWCASPAVRDRAESMMTGTTGRMRFAGADLADFRMQLPPLEEQRRIVDLLEDHLSRLDAATAYLSVSHRRVDAMERSALAECRTGELRPLAEVTAIQGGIQKQQKRAPRSNAFPFLRVANVTPRGLHLDDIHRIELFDGELDRLRLVSGDLLVVEGNGSPSQIGRAALWDGSIPDCVHQNHLIRVRPRGELVPEYLEAVWNSPQNRAKLTEVASSSSGLHTLSVSKLKQLSIPVPSLGRQRELVIELDRVREARDRLGSAVIAASVRRNVLRRSLLLAAFSGRLTG